MKFVAFLAPVAALALAACATVSPQDKVVRHLVDAGVSPPVARCMAEKMVRHLSMEQLERLRDIAGLRDHDVGRMSVDELLHRVRALNDPETFEVVARAGIGCAIAG